MELEEAIKRLKKEVADCEQIKDLSSVSNVVNNIILNCTAIETVLQALEKLQKDSIPKKKIEDKIKVRNDINDDYAKNWRKKDEAFFIAEIEKNILQELLEDK